MASFPLERHYSSIISDMMYHADRIRAYAAQDFPLTVDDMERMFNAPSHLEMMRTMEAEGVGRMPYRQSAMRNMEPSTHNGIIRATRLCIHGQSFLATLSPGIGEELLLDARHLTQETYKSLVKWTNRAVRAARQANLIHRTTETVIYHCSTTTQLLGMWPSLVPYIRDELLVARFRARNRKILRIEPRPEERSAMAAVDALLSGAMLLPKPDPVAPTGMQCNVRHWRSLPGDMDTAQSVRVQI